MIKVPRSQSTAIKNVIYPNSKKQDLTHHKKNIDSLKQKQIVNKQKKDDQENYIKRILK